VSFVDLQRRVADGSLPCSTGALIDFMHAHGLGGRRRLQVTQSSCVPRARHKATRQLRRQLVPADVHKMIRSGAAFGPRPWACINDLRARCCMQRSVIGNATLEIDEATAISSRCPATCTCTCRIRIRFMRRRCGRGRPRLNAGRTNRRRSRAGVKDAWGNSWFIATYLGVAQKQ